ncbi:MAG TPA: hypothetical protein VEB42_10235, partial [Chitinophagaceae bacterium]|nr:hypothetical protein [Chitinophagaceae bacterium]
ADLMIRDTFIELAQPELPKKKEKSIRFIIGPQFSPQYSSLLLRANPGRNPVYDNDATGNFAERYLNTRESQNRFSFNFSAGLKAGLIVRDRWEILGGAAFQRLNYREEVEPPAPGGGTMVPVPTVFPHSGGSFGIQSFNKQNSDPGWEGINVFNYVSLSAEVSRIFRIRMLTMKAGGGISYNYLMSCRVISAMSPDSYAAESRVSSQTRKSTVIPFLKAGIVEDLGSRASIHLSPYVFYSLHSTFNDDYAITQNPYGAGLEIMLLFRIR